MTPEAGRPGDAQAADTGSEPTRVPAAGSSLDSRGSAPQTQPSAGTAGGAGEGGRGPRSGECFVPGLRHCSETAAWIHLSQRKGSRVPRLLFPTTALLSPRNPPTVWWSGIPSPQAATWRCCVPSAESRRPGAVPGRPAAIHMTALGRAAVWVLALGREGRRPDLAGGGRDSRPRNRARMSQLREAGSRAACCVAGNAVGPPAGAFTGSGHWRTASFNLRAKGARGSAWTHQEKHSDRLSQLSLPGAPPDLR